MIMEFQSAAVQTTGGGLLAARGEGGVPLNIRWEITLFHANARR